MKKIQHERRVYQPGVQSNLLLDSASTSRCRLDKHCTYARKAIALRFSRSALVNFLDVFSRNAYQNGELFQNGPQYVMHSNHVPYRIRSDRRQYYQTRENVLLLKQKIKIIEINLSFKHGYSVSLCYFLSFVLSLRLFL